MCNILICNHCHRSFEIKQMGRHLLKIHNQLYKDYVKNNLEEFKLLGWKLCSDCGECFKGNSEKCGNCYTKTHKINTDLFVMCKYCNTSIHSKVLSQHLQLHHNVGFKDYIKENLKDFEKFNWYECVICKTICKSYSKSHHQPTCSTECIAKLRETWTGNKSIRFGKVLSDETKQKIGSANKGKQPFLGKYHSLKTKQHLSEIRIKNGLSKGINNPMYGKTHTPEAIEKIFKHRKMNKLEHLVANELDKVGIKYIFQFFINNGNICKSYDFKIKDKPIILEIDGDFWHGNPNIKNHYIKVKNIQANDKIKDELAATYGYKIIRLWESDIKKDTSIILKYII